MSSSIHHSSVSAATAAQGLALAQGRIFFEKLNELYGLVQRSDYVFASPLGPIDAEGRQVTVPRFVYFGPGSSDASLRLAFLAGVDHRDLRSSAALLYLVEGLALRPDIGQSLQLSIVPLVDVVGAQGLLAGERDLNAENWGNSKVAELKLLERDARRHAYHGFIRVETSTDEDFVNVELRSSISVSNLAPELELVSSEEVGLFEVRWSAVASHHQPGGPLSISDDFSQAPFELVLRIPQDWDAELYQQAVSYILKRFIVRHRGFVSYGQHL